MLIERDRSLLVVNVQERLVPAMAEPAGMLANCALLPEGAICAKTAFACTTDPEIQARLRAAGRAAIEEFRELSR